MREDLEAIMPGQFGFTVDRDYADYIYLRSDLATLKGKKFQSKRNHINKFRNTYPDYKYSPITKDRRDRKRTTCPDLRSQSFRRVRTDGRYPARQWTDCSLHFRHADQ